MSNPRSSPSAAAVRDGAPSIWTAGQLDTIGAHYDVAPLIHGDDVVRITPDLDIWDAWPIQDADSTPSALEDGTTLWMALGAPQFADPEERHGHARIHLLSNGANGWRHLGPAMTDGFSTGKSLGVGLPGTKRLVSDFQIKSAVGKGTTVTIIKWRNG